MENFLSVKALTFDLFGTVLDIRFSGESQSPDRRVGPGESGPT